ncbi:MAG: PTS sugar transporter subunit IIA [Thermoguttaceae bacterium]|nr:PTS sugar transporter subunit IIA [Thermoguttaceae bacterium]
MAFADFIQFDAVITDLKAQTKNEVIAEMVEALVKSGDLKQEDAATVVEAVLNREALGTTGLGHGLAMPHSKVDCVDKVVGAVAISQGNGVDFDSLDAENVNLFFLVLSPENSPNEHLATLSYISSRLKEDERALEQYLKQCKTLEEVRTLLNEDDLRKPL